MPRPVLVTMPSTGGAQGAAVFAGDVRAREETIAAFRVGGQLLRRHVDVGDRVRAGELLAELDPGDLRLQARAAQAQLAAAEAEHVRASAERARYAALAGQQLISRSALDAQTALANAAAGQVAALRAQRDVARNQNAYSQLRAAATGVVSARHAEAGQVVAAGQPVFALAGDGAREVAIDLPEQALHDVHVGQPVQVELWSDRGRHLDGRIREIAPAADPRSRTFAARVTLLGDSARAGLGQSARVFVGIGGNAPPALQLPLAAVQRASDGSTAVWVVGRADARVRLTTVRIGALGNDSVPILGGLARDALVVAAGGHLLREGQAVTAVDRDNRPMYIARDPSGTPRTR